MTTVRTIKLKRSSQAYGDSSGSANLSSPAAPESTPPPDVTSAEPAAPAQTAAAPAHPEETSAAPAPAHVAVAAPKTVPDKSTVWFMLIALFAAIGIMVILGLQYSEMSFYKLAPSVWLPGK